MMTLHPTKDVMKSVSFFSVTNGNKDKFRSIVRHSFIGIRRSPPEWQTDKKIGADSITDTEFSLYVLMEIYLF